VLLAGLATKAIAAASTIARSRRGKTTTPGGWVASKKGDPVLTESPPTNYATMKLH